MGGAVTQDFYVRFSSSSGCYLPDILQNNDA
jgi:hypothetical protein